MARRSLVVFRQRQLIAHWLDEALAGHAESPLSKFLAVLPAGSCAEAESVTLHALFGGADSATRERLEALRLATDARRKLRLTYLDLTGATGERVMRPLACLHLDARRVVRATRGFPQFPCGSDLDYGTTRRTFSR